MKVLIFQTNHNVYKLLQVEVCNTAAFHIQPKETIDAYIKIKSG